MKKIKKILIIIVAVIILTIGGSLVYMSIPIKNIDEEALNSTADVTVTMQDGNLFFDGKGEDSLFIYYPGGRVDYTAYSKLMKEIAKNGIDCVVVKMPFNFALLGINKAEDIINNTDYNNYYGGGHSLGGVAFSMYLKEHADLFNGLILTASYPNNDLSDLDISVLSIKGSLDGLISQDVFEEAKSKLPANSEYVIIEGGNHAQYGTYGFQSKDNVATISNEEQISLTAKYIVDFINEQK